MRRIPFVRIIVLALALPAAGCAMQFNSRTLGVPVTMADPPAQVAVADSFEVTARAVHLLWGLVPAKQPSLQHLLASQLGTGSGVYSLVIRTRKTWMDVVFTGLTLGIISPTSVTFSGVIGPARP